MKRFTKALFAGVVGALCSALAYSEAMAQAAPAPVNNSSSARIQSFSLTSASASAAFVPTAGKAFHLNVPAGTMSAVCHLERMSDGSHWTPYTIVGNEFYVMTLTGQGVSEDLFEGQIGVSWRFDCGALLGSYTSGTVAGSFVQ